MTKEIWIPSCETKATVRDGNVVVWEEMTLKPKAIGNKIGFEKEPEPKKS